MTNFKHELRKGSKKESCAGCKQKTFVPYVDTQTGQPLAWDVGKCDRENKCRWDKKPKEFFAENPTAQNRKFTKTKKSIVPNHGFTDKPPVTIAPDFIPFNQFKATLGNYEKNNFVKFLLHLFPDCGEEIQDVLKMYFVGTWKDGLTVFWQIDKCGKIRTGKIMRYDALTGKRQVVRTWTEDGETRQLKIDWMHGKIKKDFNLMQIFFGAHLLPKHPNKPVAIVESEKSAILGSLCFPEFVWLAIGSKQSLKVEKIKRLGNRQIILYPDADGFEAWQAVATDAQRQGVNVKVSSLIENQATAEQKANGFDLADYLLSQQTEINQYNSFVDSYNVKLEAVLNDESLLTDFETILNEQKAVAVYNGLSELEAETLCTHPDNVRSVALSV
jgi:hypothetical protein